MPGRRRIETAFAVQMPKTLAAELGEAMARELLRKALRVPAFNVTRSHCAESCRAMGLR